MQQEKEKEGMTEEEKKIDDNSPQT